MKFEVLNGYTGNVQFVAEIDCADDTPRAVKLGLAVKWAVKTGASLDGASLDGARLYRASLNGASLNGAILNGANLNRAILNGASLDGARLYRASLNGASLNGASLNGASLDRANLNRASLNGASLDRANLNRASLNGADLCRASLNGADLYRANLDGATGADLAIARTRILPEGDLIGWKKCRDNVLVKLRIPADAKRSHAFGRKCRAEFADRLEVIGAEVGVSNHDGKTEYRPGERIHCDRWCDDWQQECAGGIHFFITKEEAEAWP